MRWMVVCCGVVIASCVNAPQPDNPGSSARSQDRNEARGLEAAEADCSAQGKHAEAQRVEGETLYHCVD
jgi:hypothetical protein